MSDNIIKWTFPTLTMGRGAGGNNDGGKDQFINPLSSMVREVLQNSIDAKLNNNEPVRVRFNYNTIPKDSMFTSLKDPLLACVDAANVQNQKSKVDKYKQAIKKIDEENPISLLSIHDFNTKGVDGPIRSSELKGSWFALINSSGGLSQKEGNEEDSGGSFGHGAKSVVKMTGTSSVFYYTNTTNENNKLESRFAGKAYLQTHKSIEYENKSTLPIGWYGIHDRENDDILPLLDSDIPEFISMLRGGEKENTGTSILIPYTDFGEDLLPETMICTVANYFCAISDNLLEVEIGSQEQAEREKMLSNVINKENLIDHYIWARKNLENQKDMIDHLKISEWLESIETILHPTINDKFETPEFGEVEWFLRLDDGNNQIRTKRVGIARSSGMMICKTPDFANLQRFSADHKNFDMFIRVRGNEGNKMLKLMENPSHDKFSPDWIEDEGTKKKVKAQYSLFTDKIKSILLEYATYTTEDEEEVPTDLFNGMSSDLDGNNKLVRSSEVQIFPRNSPEYSSISGRTKKIGRGNKKAPGGGKKSGNKERKKGGSGVQPGDDTKELISIGDRGEYFNSGRSIDLENFRAVYHNENKQYDFYFNSIEGGNFLVQILKVGEKDNTYEPLEFVEGGSKTKFLSWETESSTREHFSINYPKKEDFCLKGKVVKIID